MADNRIPSQWQLQETGETRDEWMLHEDEQRLPEHMQLQEEPHPATPESAWQPIDYRAMQQAASKPRGRGGAVLGTLVFLVLAAVAGYMIWFYFGGSGESTTQTPTDEVATVAEPQDAAAAAPASAVVTTTAEAAPTAAPQPAVVVEPTLAIPAPTPTVPMVKFRQAAVIEEYGVNARREPLSTSDLIEVLAKGTVLTIASGPSADAEGNQWYEVPLADKSRAWVAAQYVALSEKELPENEARTVFAGQGMDAEFAELLASMAAAAAADATRLGAGAAISATAPVTGSAAPPAAGAAPAIALGAELTPSDEITTTTAPVIAAAAPITVSGVISAVGGLNLRREPQAGENIIELVPNTTTVSIIGRSALGDWLQVQLADGKRGWLAAAYVVAQRSLDVIPLGTTQPLTPTLPLVAPPVAIPTATPAPAAASAAGAGLSTAATTTSTTGLALPTPTPAVAATPVPVALTAAADGSVGTLTVSSVLGVNVRPAPSQDSLAVAQLKWNDTALALGRNPDGSFIKVRLADGRTGWVAASAVAFPAGLGALPLVE